MLISEPVDPLADEIRRRRELQESYQAIKRDFAQITEDGRRVGADPKGAQSCSEYDASLHPAKTVRLHISACQAALVDINSLNESISKANQQVSTHENDLKQAKTHNFLSYAALAILAIYLLSAQF